MNDAAGCLPISVAVLAGGQSRRMGTDKALLPLRAGDPPLAEVVLNHVRSLTDDLFIVATDRPAYQRFGVPVVADRFAGGSLGGIATAVDAAAHDACLVVACDMPFLSVALLRWMAAVRRAYDVLVPEVPGESRQGRCTIYQTLHAIYAKSALPAITGRLARDERQVIGFFPEVRVQAIGPDEVHRFDPNGLTFFNANSPETAGEARRILDQRDERQDDNATGQARR